MERKGKKKGVGRAGKGWEGPGRDDKRREIGKWVVEWLLGMRERARTESVDGRE